MQDYGLAVKALIVNEDGRMLMLRRSSVNASSVACWEWPGGKVDPGENFASAVVRETREEAGLDVEITGLAGATEFEMPGIRVVMLCLSARIVGGRSIKLSLEHDHYAWVSTEEIADLPLVAETRQFILDCAAQLSGMETGKCSPTN